MYELYRYPILVKKNIMRRLGRREARTSDEARERAERVPNSVSA